MTPFDRVMIPIRSNWFQTNPLEHKSYDRAGNTVSCVYYQCEDMALQGQIRSTFVIVLWFRKNRNSRQGLDVGSCESLVSYDFQNLFSDNFGTVSSNIHLKQFKFLSHWNNVEKNGAFSLFETSVKGNVTLVYI